MTINEVLELFKECDLTHLTGDNYEDKILVYLPENLEYEVETGATKLVFIFSNCDFVLKIPFSGFGEEIEEYSEEDGEWHFTGEYEYTEFQGAKDGEHGSDYCLAEANIWERAWEWGNGEIAQLFARTEFVDFIGGCPVYKQPVCKTFNLAKDKSKYSEEKVSSTRSSCVEKGYHCFNRYWLSDVLDYYGQQIFDLFMNFIEEERITDLHEDNLGYLNGAPVLIDYASYDD